MSLSFRKILRKKLEELSLQELDGQQIDALSKALAHASEGATVTLIYESNVREVVPDAVSIWVLPQSLGDHDSPDYVSFHEFKTITRLIGPIPNPIGWSLFKRYRCYLTAKGFYVEELVTADD